MGQYDSLPIVAAAGIVIGAAVLAAPAADAVVLTATKAQEIGSAVLRGGEFAKTAAQSCASEYRAAAGTITNVRFTDPKEFGKALGAQSWTATEEFGRSAIVGAGVAGGAWAARTITGAVENAFPQPQKHVAQP